MVEFGSRIVSRNVNPKNADGTRVKVIVSASDITEVDEDVDILANMRARARALVSTGVFVSVWNVFDKFSADDLKRLTKIESKNVLNEGPPLKKVRYSVLVREKGIYEIPGDPADHY